MLKHASRSPLRLKEIDSVVSMDSPGFSIFSFRELSPHSKAAVKEFCIVEGEIQVCLMLNLLKYSSSKKKRVLSWITVGW